MQYTDVLYCADIYSLTDGSRQLLQISAAMIE